MNTKKVEESVEGVAQVIFRPSAERRGYYLCHYGHLVPDVTFAEASELSFSEFLNTLEVPSLFLSSFAEELDAAELEVFDFGYLSQGHFDSFMHYFVASCDTVQLYPGMLVLTFVKKENEG